jgi:hypothetical protein
MNQEFAIKAKNIKDETAPNPKNVQCIETCIDQNWRNIRKLLSGIKNNPE